MNPAQAIPPALTGVPGERSLLAGVGLRFWHLPVDGSWHGHALDSHLLLNLWITLALFALSNILLIIGVLSRRRAHRPIHKFTLEYLPLLAFALTFLLLAIRANSLWATQRYTGAAPDALQVEVTGMQFAWYFRYPGPDGKYGATNPKLMDPSAGGEAAVGLNTSDPAAKDDVVTGTMYLPVNREVDLSLRSVDVIHDLFVPSLRFKQDAVPGLNIHMHFKPIAIGEYEIACAELCGLGHYKMHGMVHVVSQEDFDKWLAAREAEKQ